MSFNNYNTVNQKFDRFTNANQSGVMLTKVAGNALFLQTVIPASIRSGVGTANYATIKAVTDASFTFVHDGTPYSDTGININTDSNVTDLDSFCALLQTAFQTETGDSTISITNEGGKFNVTSEQTNISFSPNGTGTDLGELMAMLQAVNPVEGYNPVVTPLIPVEGYTGSDNDPQDLTTFYKFDDNLEATFGSNLTAVEGTPTYSTVGSLKAVGTSSLLCLLQGLAPLGAYNFELSFTFRMNALPESGDTMAVAFLTDDTDFTNVYGSFTVADDGTLTFELDTKTGAGSVTLTQAGLAINTTYLVRVYYDGNTEVGLIVNEGTPVVDDLTSSFDFSVSQYLTLPLGTGEVDTGIVALDGKMMNFGIFAGGQNAGYWTDIYNGGSIKYLYYLIDGTLVLTFRDTPEYVTSVQLDVVTPIFQETSAGLIRYNVFDNTNANGRTDQIPGQAVMLTTDMRENMDGSIFTVNIDLTKGAALLNGISVTFFE
jgi:hypothetical protein